MTTPGTTLELIVPGCLNGFTDDEVDLMGTLSLLAGRPANWNVLGVSAMSPDRTEHQLAASDSIAAARRSASCADACRTPCSYASRSSTGRSSTASPDGARSSAWATTSGIAALKDPEVRRRMAAGASSDEAGILRRSSALGPPR